MSSAEHKEQRSPEINLQIIEGYTWASKPKRLQDVSTPLPAAEYSSETVIQGIKEFGMSPAGRNFLTSATTAAGRNIRTADFVTMRLQVMGRSPYTGLIETRIGSSERGATLVHAALNGEGSSRLVSDDHELMTELYDLAPDMVVEPLEEATVMLSNGKSMEVRAAKGYPNYRHVVWTGGYVNLLPGYIDDQEPNAYMYNRGNKLRYGLTEGSKALFRRMMQTYSAVFTRSGERIIVPQRILNGDFIVTDTEGSPESLRLTTARGNLLEPGRSAFLIDRINDLLGPYGSFHLGSRFPVINDKIDLGPTTLQASGFSGDAISDYHGMADFIESLSPRQRFVMNHLLSFESDTEFTPGIMCFRPDAVIGGIQDELKNDGAFQDFMFGDGMYSPYQAIKELRRMVSSPLYIQMMAALGAAAIPQVQVSQLTRMEYQLGEFLQTD